MFTSPDLRKLIACALTCALFATGLIIITTQESRIAHLPASLTDGAAPEKTAPRVEAVDDETRERVQEAVGKMPLSFEENRGQVDTEVEYISRGSGYTLFLTPTEAVLSLRGAEGDGRKEIHGARPGRQELSHERKPPSATRNREATVLRMKMKGANPEPAVKGESKMRVQTNYFVGNDPKNWHTDVARYERVRYAQVYPGVDVTYYGKQRQLEYDFEVAPGADTKQIALEFSGVRQVQVESETGELVLKTGDGEVRQRRPVTYQEVGGERREVASRYVMRGEREVGFEVGEYDRTRPLVIDPVLTYSTYLGGSSYEYAWDIAVDSSGNAYVMGWTESSNFPVVNQFQTKPPVETLNANVYVSKINTNASGADSLVYSTYLGGTHWDTATAIAADSSGNVYVTGLTYSTDFPTLHQFQTKQGDVEDYDAFVTRLDTNLSGVASLRYSTYLGGSLEDNGSSITVDSSGITYVTGGTYSANFPTFHEYQKKQDDDSGDAFVTKIDTNLAGEAAILYSTCLGGTVGYEDNFYGGLDGGSDIAVDSSGYIYVVGGTLSIDFPTLHEFQTDQPYQDCFVAKLDPSASGASQLLYSTYIGGDGHDGGSAIVVDSSGIAYVAGTTESYDFPTLNPYQAHPFPPNRFGVVDGFIVKLDTNVSGEAALLYSTYFGGGHLDGCADIALDAAGHVYVTGNTYSENFPTLNAYQLKQPSPYEASDAFVAKFDLSASGAASLLYSTYLGGTGDDSGSAIVVDSSGSAYVTGMTQSYNFPKLHQYRGACNCEFDTFVTKLTDTYTVSGRVTSDGTTGIGGVTVKLGGSRDATVVTDRTGDYSFTLLAGGDYTVTTSKRGLTFVVPERNFAKLLENQPNVNFKTRAATVSGRVTIGTTAGEGLGGVKMTLTGGDGFTTRTVVTTSTGDYSFGSVPTPGNYRVTPSRTSYDFGPGQAILLDVAANRPGTNFIASLKTYAVSGAVRLGGVGLGGVTVRLESPAPDGFAARMTTTDSEGRYTFLNVPAGRSYTVIPVKLGYQFAPANEPLANLSEDRTGVNFPVKVYSVGGRVTRAGTTHGLGGVTVTLTSAVPAGFPARTAQTNSLGYYLFTNLPAGRNYTLKPARNGFTFSPAAHDVAKLSGHVPAAASTSFTGTGP